jgi:hypothetical protein
VIGCNPLVVTQTGDRILRHEFGAHYEWPQEIVISTTRTWILENQDEA